MLNKLRNFINFGLYCLVFFVPLFFWDGEFDFSKAIFLRIFIAVLLFLFVLNIFLQHKFKVVKKHKIFFVILFLSFISSSVSTFFAINSNISFFGSHTRQFGLYSILHYIIFLLIIIFHVKNFKEIKSFISIILFSSFLVSFYGLIQFSSLDIFKWSETGRIFSTLGQPNFFGHYLVVVIPITIWSMFFLCKNNIIKVLIFILLLMQIASLVLTYSRSAWIAFFVGTVSSLIIILWGYNKKRMVMGFVTVLGFLIFIIIGLNFSNASVLNKNYNNAILNRVVSVISFNSFYSGSVRMRVEYWDASMKEFKNTTWGRRLFGYGMDNTGIVIGKYYKKDWGVYESINSFPDRAHNLFFDTWFNFGIIGVFFIFLFFVYIFSEVYLFLRNNKKTEQYFLVLAIIISILMYFINNLFNFSSTTNFLYFAMYIGILIVIIFNNDFEYREHILPKYLRGLVLFLLFIVCSISIYVYNINPMRGKHYLIYAKNFQKYNCVFAMNNVKKAMILAPFDEYYRNKYIWHGINCFEIVNNNEDRNVIKKNLEVLINDIDINSIDYSAKVNIATAYGLFAENMNSLYYNRAVDLYNILVQNYPFVTVAYKRWARFEANFGNVQLARQKLEEALNILPDTNNSKMNQMHKNKVLREKESIDKLLKEL